MRNGCFFLFIQWWRDEAEIEQRIVEATINWLDDPDNPYGQEKIWHYLNK